MVLGGIKVVDLGRYIAGPYCAQMLGDMGAEVIKVESLRGDDTRREEPCFDGTGLYFMNYNRNKMSIAVNLRTNEGKEILTRLVERADVLIQNFRPGVMESMGFPYTRLARINPRLVYVSISGFGVKGSYSDRVAIDDILQAMSGLMDITGQPDGIPTLVGQPIVDTLTGLYSFSAALLGLHHRQVTGQGQEIRVNLYGSALQAVNPSLTYYLAAGIADRRAGNRSRYQTGINTYPTLDGYVHLAAYADSHWAALATRISGPQLSVDPRYAKAQRRAQHKDAIDSMIREWVAQYATQDVIDMMVQDGIPCGPVRSIPEVATDPELREADRLVDVPDPNGNSVPLFKLPIDVPSAPATVRLAPPLLGEHTIEIASDILGYPRPLVKRWCEEGILSAATSHRDLAPIPPET